MSGLFSTFNVATRGMSAQQKALDVTSHNIANANTEGYSRQRATMETSRPFGMPSMNNATGPGQLGTGVQISAITRIRDSFLDYQVRTENGTSGRYQGREQFLSEVESIMNEPSDTGVSTLLGKVFDTWQELSLHPESSNSRTVVAQQSKALTDELNNTYNQLINLKKNSQDVIKQSVVDVNSMLDQLNVLNQQIISVKVGGNEPNDLMDKRDLLVDQLSLKFGIDIKKKSLGGEDLTAEGYGASLVKSVGKEDVSRFAYVSSIVQTSPGTYNVTYYKNGDTSKASITTSMSLDATKYKELDQGRVLLEDKAGVVIPFTPKTGELQGYMSVQGDIDKYVGELNNLAKGIAFSINAVHSGKSDAASDNLKFFVNKMPDGTVGDEKDITAGNISINEIITEDPMKINVGKDNTSGPTDGTRALAIAQLRDVKLKIQSIDTPIPSTRATFLAGVFDTTTNDMVIKSSSEGMTIGGYFKDTVNRIAVQTQEAKRIVTNHEALLAGLEESRTSISGVSLDEEMANMIQFQHAYQANAKIISTVDELLDLIINGLKK